MRKLRNKNYLQKNLFIFSLIFHPIMQICITYFYYNHYLSILFSGDKFLEIFRRLKFLFIKIILIINRMTGMAYITSYFQYTVIV